MADLLKSIIKFVLLITIAYCSFSIFFSNRVDTQYFSVVLSDGWTVSKTVTSEDGVVQGSFYNKRTKTYVDLKIQPNSLQTEWDNFTSSLIEMGNKLLNSDLEQSDFTEAPGYTYATFHNGEIKGIIFKTKNTFAQCVINVYGPKHADGIDFVNTFFKTDETLFPHFIDPTVPVNNFNYVLWIRTLKTWIHARLFDLQALF